MSSLNRHGRPCAGDPDDERRGAFLTEMTGTDPRIKSGDGHDAVDVIPGRSEAEGKGIQSAKRVIGSPSRSLRTAGDDKRSAILRASQPFPERLYPTV
ncbi:hypothetical protein J4G37_17125 [Microvirga sp. 3-52]|nr:hypothetical protein [Microvirga sp. 3-52]